MFTSAKFLNAFDTVRVSAILIMAIVLTIVGILASPQASLLALLGFLISALIMVHLVNTHLKGYCRYQNAIAAFKQFPMMIIVVDNKSTLVFDSLAETVYCLLNKYGINIPSGMCYQFVDSLADVQKALVNSPCKCALVINGPYKRINFALIGQSCDSLWQHQGYYLIPYNGITYPDGKLDINRVARLIVETTLEKVNINTSPQSSGIAKWFKRPSISLTGAVFEEDNPEQMLLCVEFHGESSIGEKIVSYAWDFDGDGNIDRIEYNGKIKLLGYPFPEDTNPAVTVTTISGASSKASLSKIDIVKKVDSSTSEES